MEPGTALADWDMDSMAAVGLIMHFEEAFSLTLKEDFFDGAQTVQDVLDRLNA